MNVFCLHLLVHLCFGSTTCWANWIWGYPCRPLVPLGGFLRHCFRRNAKQLVLAMKMAAQNKLRRDPALERVSCWLRVHFPACQQDDFLGAWFNLWDMILRLSQRKELFAGLAKEAQTVWGKDGWNRTPPTKPLPISVIRLDVSSLRLWMEGNNQNLLQRYAITM